MSLNQVQAAPQAALYQNRWNALAVLCTAQFLVIMDTSIIGVALPAIKDALGYTQTGLQWIFNAYVIFFGGLLLLGGKLADVYGARRIFLLGFFLLMLASALAGAATTPFMLNTGRALQGLGSALIAPAALTLVMTMFTDPAELGKALGLWGASAAAGGSAGVFLGGVITEWLSWRWVFFVNIPIALAVLLYGTRVLAAGFRQRSRIDLSSAVLITSALMAFVYALVNIESRGWASVHTWGVALLAMLMLVVFIARQKNSRAPLLPLGIFRAPNLAAGNGVMALLAAAWIPLWFFLNLYLQQVLQLNAFKSGLALLPMTVVIMILMVTVTGKLVQRFGFKPVLVVGLALLAVSLVWFSRLPVQGSFTGHVLLPSILAAAGMSLAYIPATVASMSGARPEETGLASGIVNTTYQVGSAVGLAVMALLASYVTHSSVSATAQHTEALHAGFRAAFAGAAAVAALATLLAMVRIKK